MNDSSSTSLILSVPPLFCQLSPNSSIISMLLYSPLVLSLSYIFLISILHSMLPYIHPYIIRCKTDSSLPPSLLLHILLYFHLFFPTSVYSVLPSSFFSYFFQCRSCSLFSSSSYQEICLSVCKFLPVLCQSSSSDFSS